MKKNIVKCATSHGFVLAALSVALAVPTISCKTAATSETSVGTTNTGEAAVVSPPATQANTRKSEGHFYTCAMHPTVRSLDPDGKCPICGMALLPAETVHVINPASGKTNTAATFPAVSGDYSCPMHPTVLSTNPDDKCPSCGMPVLPVESPVFTQGK